MTNNEYFLLEIELKNWVSRPDAGVVSRADGVDWVDPDCYMGCFDCTLRIVDPYYYIDNIPLKLRRNVYDGRVDIDFTPIYIHDSTCIIPNIRIAVGLKATI